MNHLMLSIIWIILLSILIFITFRQMFFNISELSKTEVVQLINKEDPYIIDIRNKEDYNKGHIIGSIHMSEKDIKNSKLEKLENIQNRSIIIVCINGFDSIEFARKIKNIFGLKNIYVLKEGISGWISEHLPLTKN